MPAFPEIVRPCMEEAVARSVRLLERAIDHACTALQEEARRTGTMDRLDMACAADELLQLRAQWRAAYPSALRKAIDSHGTARAPVRINPSSLTLVDDSDVMESIESSRLAQELASLVDKPLAELDRFMSSALELEGIQPEQNPLRPSTFAQALRSLMNDPAPRPGRPALWMRHMGKPMAAELKPLYESCSKLLAGASVKAADYRVVTGPAPLAPAHSSPAVSPAHAAGRGRPSKAGVVPLRPGQEPRGRSPMSGWLELATERIGGPALREFLFGGGGAHSQLPLAPNYYRQVDEELAALEARWDEAPPDPQDARQYRHLPAVERPARPVDIDTALSRETWGAYGAPRQRSLVRTRLRKQASSVGQVMGLEVVRQLVGQVAQDPRLLAPVREAMVALEPSLARLALNSPRFFAEHDNPARTLLERIAQRSFKYNDEFSTEFNDFFEGVKDSFNALNRLETLPDAAPFESALARLAADWSEQDREEESQCRQVVQSVELAERRQREADQIAWDLSQRSDLDGAPALVQDFLFGPWSLVLAQARLGSPGDEMDPGGFVGVITDLLWSVKREATLRDPARAFEVIPRVVPKLRAGLELLGHPESETNSFFQALERLHRPVLKLRAKHRRQSLVGQLAASPLDEDLQPAPAQKPQAREVPWLRDVELRECGFQDTLPSDYALLEPAAPVPAPAGSPVVAAKAQPIPITTVAGVPIAEPQADALIATMGEGCWVDLFSRQRWHRARLTWASANRTLFMFTSHGGRPHSMTKRSLQRLVMSRLVRPLDSHEVIQHALDTMVRERSEPLAA